MANKRHKQEFVQSMAIVPFEVIEDDQSRLLWWLDLLLRPINWVIDALARLWYKHD